MIRFERPLFRVLAWFLAAPLFADVLVVDADGAPGADFTTLEAAIGASAPGDVLVVREGLYAVDPIETFPVTHGLQILAEEGAFVHLESPIEVTGLAAGERVVLRGLHLEAPASGSEAWTSTILEDNEGSIWIEDCELLSVGFAIGIPQGLLVGSGLRAANCADVVVVDSVIHGNRTGSFHEAFSPGIEAVNSTVHVFDCEILGGANSPASAFELPFGAPGVALESSSFYAAGTAITGGQGADAGGFFCGTSGGPGIRVATADSAATLFDTTLTGGAVGSSPCFDASPGPVSIVEAGTLDELAGIARGFDANGPISPGAFLDIAFSGEPGDLVVLVEAVGSAGTFFPGATGPLLGAPLHTHVLGLLPASGSVAASVPGPPLPSGVSASIQLQPVFATLTEIVFGEPSLVTFYAE